MMLVASFVTPVGGVVGTLLTGVAFAALPEKANEVTGGVVLSCFGNGGVGFCGGSGSVLGA